MMALALAANAAAQDTAVWQPGHHESSAFLRLAAALDSLDQLESEESPQQRSILTKVAIDSLTALYQLHGCAWALEWLTALYASPECPPFMVGYSSDGRLRLQVDQMELQHPDFSKHGILLVALESRTASTLEAESAKPLEITIDGRRHTAVPLTQEHPAWQRLKNIAGTFAAPPLLPPGSGIAFKQLFTVPADDIVRFSAVSLEWGEYHLQLQDYQMREPQDEQE